MDDSCSIYSPQSSSPKKRQASDCGNNSAESSASIVDVDNLIDCTSSCEHPTDADLTVPRVLSHKSEKLVELETRLAAAKKAKHYPLCKLLVEVVKKQVESDVALEDNDFDSAERLDAEVPPYNCSLGTL